MTNYRDHFTKVVMTFVTFQFYKESKRCFFILSLPLRMFLTPIKFY